MDVDLLSKMVKELILDNDAVTLPGVGSFVAEYIPASFSDKGFTINPPYRRLSFRQRELNDTLLCDLYASLNSIDSATALSILGPFLRELNDVLKEKKTLILTGLGRLRATKENNFFFVPDEDLNIFPESFGLEPISLKTHVGTEREMAAEVIDITIDDSQSSQSMPALPEQPAQSMPALPEQPAPFKPSPSEQSVSPEQPAQSMPAPPEQPAPSEQSVSPEQPAQSMPAPPEQPVSPEQATVSDQPDPPVQSGAAVVCQELVEPDCVKPVMPKANAATSTPVTTVNPTPYRSSCTREETPKKLFPRVILALVISAVALLGVFLLMAHFTPELIDHILYTPEELKIINY